ncbi:hypothetical protein HQQ82_01440 [Rathayibacter sp. VKM Ac-2856]|uniref:hypothetical protein n=1 Tax=unclassified Rathayibacter TaxID=2609250 RepID=UPI0015639099|nr:MULTISPECIES: hypothetical protein [unclassified Rathayibacter]NQX03458.1 hypothetical protein [Rathayibacter sp. VKM Ac-2858]NQX18626.1 hypothetical protein [Rathayibacter sp. VKM Ac-2856]
MTPNEDGQRAERFRRALRWYPAAWRREHGDVLLGILLDEADADGRSRPGPGQRLALAVGGVRRRLGRTPGGSAATIVPLALATAFSVFYATVNWSPGVSYPGAIGPFTNPAVPVAGTLFVLALGLALSGRTGAARIAALLAATAELSIALVAVSAGWLGPGLTTAGPVAALGVLAVVPWRGRAAAAVSVLLLVGLPAVLIGIEVLCATVLMGFPALRVLLPLVVIAAVLALLTLAARRAARLERESMILGGSSAVPLH